MEKIKIIDLLNRLSQRTDDNIPYIIKYGNYIFRYNKMLGDYKGNLEDEKKYFTDFIFSQGYIPFYILNDYVTIVSDNHSTDFKTKNGANIKIYSDTCFMIYGNNDSSNYFLSKEDIKNILKHFEELEELYD